MSREPLSRTCVMPGELPASRSALAKCASGMAPLVQFPGASQSPVPAFHLEVAWPRTKLAAKPEDGLGELIESVTVTSKSVTPGVELLNAPRLMTLFVKYACAAATLLKLWLIAAAPLI